MENVTAIAQFRLDWMNSLSEEDKTKLEEEKANWANEEFKAERMAEMNATFQAADTNADGVLDATEFEDFMKKLMQNGRARGTPMPADESVSDDLKVKMFAFYDAVNAESQGVTLADFFAAGQQIQAKVAELRG